jgi:hypothetical protein
MIPIEELREFQADFESVRIKGKARHKALDALRKRFTTDFPPARIRNLTLDEYVQGKQDKTTFCYRLERETAPLGHIQGSPAIKFGVYFEKESKSYKFKRTKHPNAEAALSAVLSSIGELLSAGQSEDLDKIRQIDITPMVKGKLLFMYFPNRFLNIFSERHVDFFLAQLRINDPGVEMDLVEKKERLLAFKRNDEVMLHWSNLDFAEFLYKNWEPPSRHESTAPSALRKYLFDLPAPEDASPEFVQLQFGSPPEPNEKSLASREKSEGTTDFAEKGRRNKILGNHGEDIVFLAEQIRLKAAGRPDLAEKVDPVCKRDDAAGYDILSFEPDGTERYIEVKCTAGKVPTAGSPLSFFLSANELVQAHRLGSSFHLYLVFDAKSKSPKILRIANPAKLENIELRLQPTAYRASLIVATK